MGEPLASTDMRTDVLAFAGMALPVTAVSGLVAGRSEDDGPTRTVIITASGDWSGSDWDAVSVALQAHDGYTGWDYTELADGSEQWRITYRRLDEHPGVPDRQGLPQS